MAIFIVIFFGLSLYLVFELGIKVGQQDTIVQIGIIMKESILLCRKLELQGVHMSSLSDEELLNRLADQMQKHGLSE